MRFTKKEISDIGKHIGHYFVYTKYANKESNAYINKLGQLEDIEELCIKMTTQIIYEKFSNTNIGKLDFIGYSTAYDFENNCIMVYKGHEATIYSVNEYGKTWALTKEVLL